MMLGRSAAWQQAVKQRKSRSFKTDFCFMCPTNVNETNHVSGDVHGCWFPITSIEKEGSPIGGSMDSERLPLRLRHVEKGSFVQLDEKLLIVEAGVECQPSRVG